MFLVNSETAVVREENESPNDRNDRSTYSFPKTTNIVLSPYFVKGIRKAAAWYRHHIAQTLSQPRTVKEQIARPVIVLLTNDAENRRRAEADGVKCLSGMSSTISHFV